MSQTKTPDRTAHPHLLPELCADSRAYYASIGKLAYLMQIICGASHWVDRLKGLIQHHNIDTHKMGFPANWQTRPIWM